MSFLGARGSGSTGTGTTSCEAGWQLVESHDNSFVWDGGLFDARSASWQGSVQLLADFDADCNVLAVRVDYTGPTGSGTLALTGNLFVSFTVQHPGAFTDYAAVADNAYGDLDYWSRKTGKTVGPVTLPAHIIMLSKTDASG